MLGASVPQSGGGTGGGGGGEEGSIVVVVVVGGGGGGGGGGVGGGGVTDTVCTGIRGLSLFFCACGDGQALRSPHTQVLCNITSIMFWYG